MYAHQRCARREKAAPPLMLPSGGRFCPVLQAPSVPWSRKSLALILSVCNSSLMVGVPAEI